jgi:hypothetical protein
LRQRERDISSDDIFKLSALALGAFNSFFNCIGG